jgi:hypothetical protein
MKLPNELKAGLRLAITLPIIALMAVPFMLYKLVTLPFEKPLELKPEEAAAFLRKCVDGQATEDELDYFSGVQIADPKLNEIMEELGSLFGRGWPVAEPPSPETRAALRKMLRQVEAMR